MLRLAGQELAVAGGEVDRGVADLQGDADAELLLGVLQEVVHIAEAVEAEVVLEGHRGAGGEAGAVDLRRRGQGGGGLELERLDQEDQAVALLDRELAGEAEEREQHVLAALVAEVEVGALLSELDPVLHDADEAELGGGLERVPAAGRVQAPADGSGSGLAATARRVVGLSGAVGVGVGVGWARGGRPTP
jgi:hypothetical protein